jgi:hypothetical protein
MALQNEDQLVLFDGHGVRVDDQHVLSTAFDAGEG